MAQALSHPWSRVGSRPPRVEPRREATAERANPWPVSPVAAAMKPAIPPGVQLAQVLLDNGAWFRVRKSRAVRWTGAVRVTRAAIPGVEGGKP
jgi:hypothetical protein